MLYRKVSKYIEDFYQTSKNALLLTGARQTGKTFVCREFGRTFKSFIEINFIEHPELAEIFDGVTSPDEIILRISAFTTKPMIPEETLIFFDEIQNCDSLMTAVKFLVDDGRYRYILSGSLLRVELKNIKSQPVGYLGIKELFPLDLEEFIINMGISETVRKNLKDCWKERKPVDPFVHEKLLQLFRLYLITGGMPSAVAEYKKSNNVNTVMRVQQDILSTYRMDISQCAVRDRLKIKEIFDIIPSELDNRNKRFILKSLNSHAKFDRYANSFLWLKDSGVAIPVYGVKEPKAPLRLSETRNLFKLFSNDVGLLASQYAEGIQLKILTGDCSINIGSVYENAVAQELVAHGIVPYFYNNKRRGEVDFVISIGGKVIPVEVKSGKDYTKHAALMNLLTDYSNNLSEAIVFSNENFESKGKITYAPIYMVMFLVPEKSTIGIYKIDLGSLAGN